MCDSVIDDVPGQGYLFDEFREKKEETNTKEENLGDWLEDILEDEFIGRAKVFSCHPDRCVNDCTNCRIFSHRREKPPREESSGTQQHLLE